MTFKNATLKNTGLTFLAATAICFVIPNLASAHHGFAAFDTKSKVTLKGTVTEFHFVSPHAVVDFEVKDDKNQVQKWQGELTSPAHLVPKGWSATSLEPGDGVTITGYRAKSGAQILWITGLVPSNGKDLKLDNRDQK
jgi:Family of unknown function (DUF6152)